MALACGIGTQLLFPMAFLNFYAWGLILMALVMVLSLYLKRFFNPILQSITGVFTLSAIFITGYLLVSSATLTSYKNFAFNPSRTDADFLKVRMDDEITEKANSWRSTCNVLAAINRNGKAVKVSGKLLVYWPKRYYQNPPKLEFGDEFVFKNKVIPIPAAAFPGDFDFRAVMRYKNIQHQVFLKPEQWKVTQQGSMSIFAVSLKLRQGVINILNRHFEKKTAAMLASLIVGYRSELDPADLAAFSKTGTMHVLAVSGMHAGLLYLALILLFTGKKVASKLRIWQSIAVILCLWMFALVTGLSASVVRAAIMFTIIEVGRSILLKKGNLVNSLFAAAFLQLLITPHALIDTGFQLSYLAVLGIAVIFPWLQRLWMPPGKISALLYQSGLLSLSATIATLPITLYYFHSFPVWFIPANMIIVPLSTAIIVLGILSVVLATIPFLGFGLCMLTAHLVKWMLLCSHYIAELPYSSISNVYLGEWEAFFIAALLLALSAMAILKSKTAGLMALLAVGLAGISSWWNFFRNSQVHETIVCEIRNQLLLVQRDGNQMQVLSAPIAQIKADTLFGFMNHYCQSNDISKVTWVMDPHIWKKRNGNQFNDLNKCMTVTVKGKKYMILLDAHKFDFKMPIPRDVTFLHAGRFEIPKGFNAKRVNNEFIIL